MYEEAWNQGKIEVIDELCALDYTGVGPYGEEHGPDAVKRGIANRRSAFPDIHVTIEDVISAEDKVVREDEDPEDTPWPKVPIAESPHRDVSDHYVVWAELALPKKPEPAPAEGDAAATESGG